MRYVAYPELDETPNIVVDGKGTPSTTLTLSHWPHSGTPAALRADTSAEIVFRYLDRPDLHVDVEAVSNNHFDEDGLVGLFALLHPDEALGLRARLTDLATAGDFGRYSDREAARASFALSALADPERTTLEPSTFAGAYPERTANLYRALLPRLHDIAAHPERFRSLWEEEDAALGESLEALRSGLVRIDEDPTIDLAVVTIPDRLADKGSHRFTQSRSQAVHPMAIHNATHCLRTLLVQGGRYELQYRYETWVQLASRRPMPRADLGALAAALTERETRGASWSFDGVDSITPSLGHDGESSFSPPVLLAEVKAFLTTAPPAFDPYD
jgi:hypothetical protein